MKSIRESLSLSRQKIELFYSVFLLLIIPGLIVINTLLVSRSVRDDFDTELRRKADLANSIFGSTVEQNLDDTEAIQKSLDTITSAREDIASVLVVQPEAGEFRVLATDDETLKDTTISNLQFQLVMNREQSVAQLINRGEDETGRSWNVVTPIFNENQEVVALTSMDVSIAEAEEAISSTLSRSFIILFVTVFIVALLLANHFRFVEYAQLFQKVKEADQLKTDFLSVATHELKTPMSIIKGQISNVTDGIFGEVNDNIKEHLLDTINQTDRLNNLVQDLLDVSRIEQGKISFNIVQISPAKVINPLIEKFREKATEKDIKVAYEEIEGDAILLADEGRYQEIMTNLIDNAIKYSKEGSVVVRHEVKDKVIVTRVKDSGIGMSSKERARLFQRFYRIKNEKTKGIAGTGLGLWIIKQYIEKMGGKISVDSLEGVGTEFIVELPRG